MKRIGLAIGLAVIAGIALLPFSCSKKDSSDTANNPSEPTDETDAVDGNPDIGQVALSTSDLATSYPIGLAVTALPQAVDPSPGQAGAGTVLVSAASLSLQTNQPPPNQQNSDPFKKHPKEILQEAFNRLEGKADSCFDPQVFQRLLSMNGPSAICFGSEYGIIAGLSEGLMDGGATNNIIAGVPAPKNSASVLAALIADSQFQASTVKEVCMVVKAREYTAKISERINAAMDLFSGMICAAKKDDPTLTVPDVGASIDLTDKMTGIESGSNATQVTSAVITRKKDQDGRPVLLSEISFKLGQSNNSSGVFKVRLIHSPSASGNAEYNGVLQLLSDQVEGSITRDALLSLGYVKSGNTLETQRIRFEAREGNFVRGTDKSSADPMAYFGADGRLDLNAVDPDGSAQNANDYLSGMYYLIGDVNPSTYAGSLSVWNNPGGNYQEAARGFIFQTAANSDGTLAGCAWAGAYLGTSIRKAIKTGTPMKPTGCYTPQITGAECKNQSNPNDNQGPQVWKQCFIQDTDSVYNPDTSKNEDDTAGFDLLQTAPTDMPDIDAADFPSVVAE